MDDSDRDILPPGYEAYFSRIHGISRDQALALIGQAGNSRKRLEAAVAALKNESDG
jgi:hypothetical protein